jgi:flagellar FliJ protein
MVESQKQKVFALALSRLERAESDLKKIQSRITSFAGRMNTIGPSEVKEVSVRHEYLVSLRRRLEMKQEQIEQVKIELEKKRQALMQASQERKVIEKLKEKYDEMQAQELSYREQAMIDEVAAFGVRTINRDPSHD